MGMGFQFLSTNGVAAATNFVPWQPLAFFTNAADRLLRAYTTSGATAIHNFATTFYTVTNFNFVIRSVDQLSGVWSDRHPAALPAFRFW